MTNVLFSGILPALVTPLTERETINEDVARRLMRWHMDQGMDGFYICGATGEGPVVAPKERMRLAEIAREETRARDKKAIIHVGAIDLTTAKALARHAGDCLQCGVCETRCPFDVKIRENMQRAKKIFGY